MKHILVVDDDYDICEALQLVLGGRYRVSVAYNGAQALELLGKGNVDAVVLDLMMPVMDGEAMLAQMHARNLRVPVLVASAGNDLRRRAFNAGAQDVLAKPYDLTQLELRLARLLGGGGPSGGREPGEGSSGADGTGTGTGQQSLRSPPRWDLRTSALRRLSGGEPARRSSRPPSV